jgi:hypothetical protein
VSSPDFQIVADKALRQHLLVLKYSFKNAHYNSDLVFAGYPSKRDFVKDFEQKFLTSDAYKQIETLYNRIFKIIGENPKNSKE